MFVFFFCQNNLYDDNADTQVFYCSRHILNKFPSKVENMARRRHAYIRLDSYIEQYCDQTAISRYFEGSFGRKNVEIVIVLFTFFPVLKIIRNYFKISWMFAADDNTTAFQ